MFSIKKENKRHLRYRGMTLVEALVTLAIFTLISLAITNSIDYFYRYNAYTVAQSYQVDHARRGIESLVRDLREMTYSDNGAFPLVSRATSSVSFYSDIDRDESVELVEYILTNKILYKRVFEASGNPLTYPSTPTRIETISEYVHNDLESIDLFTYYDSAGVELSGSGVADVRSIDVALVVNIDPIREPGKYHLRSSASLRNLKEYDL